MTGIIFYFEDNDVDVWSGRNSDFDAWNYALQTTSDVRDVYVINKTDITYTGFNQEFNVQYVSECPEVVGHKTQIVCPWDLPNDPTPKVDLWDFDHETDWYMLGPAAGWHTNCGADTLVTVPQNSAGAMHSVHIASIVMAHRYGVKG